MQLTCRRCGHRARHTERGLGIDTREFITTRQRIQLRSGKRWFATEQCVEFEQRAEQAKGNLDDQRVQAFHTLDRANDVDVVDVCVTADVEGGANGLGFNAVHDAATKVAFVQRLAHVLAVAGNREHRRFRHEARQPAQVLGIKPTEHQRWPKYAMGNTAVDDQFFLRTLGVGVVIDRD